MAKKMKRATSTSEAAASSRSDFHPDYTYVKRDLSRIGMLAGFFVVVLIVISFFLK